MALSLQEIHGEGVDPDTLKLTTEQLVEMYRAGGQGRLFAALEIGRRKVNRFDKTKRDREGK